VKQTAIKETEYYAKRDSTAWKNSFMQDEKISGTYVNVNNYSHYVGWGKLIVPIIQSMAKNPEPLNYFMQCERSNYLINVHGDAATIEYDQSVNFPNGDSVFPYHTHEIRTMVKDNGQWKITSLVSIDTSINSSNAVDIENRINSIGYVFLGQKEVQNAIDVFALNVKLFPNSWNVYDSLGEAYANNGNTDEAIKNYEMSVKINPKNDNGKQWLEKLKKK
jgi:tetratricopeptide (TPR) repeat protein